MCSVDKAPNELRMKIRIHAEQILQHQNLTIATRPGPDADCRNRDGFRNLFGNLLRNAFEHHREGSQLSECLRTSQNRLCLLAVSTLHLESAVRVNRLRLH